jgi:hypothetical protein
MSSERYDTRKEAEDASEDLNAEMLGECGQDVGDGAASVVELDDDPQVSPDEWRHTQWDSQFPDDGDRVHTTEGVIIVR